MTFLEFKNHLEKYIIFSIDDVYKIDENFNRLQLNRWQNKKYITKITRRYYTFSDFQIDENILFLIANKVYSPSYISSSMALYHYGLIPENVYEITSVSTRKTKNITSQIADFSYQKIQKKLFWGYSLIEYENQYLKIAEIEKALLDYFYLNPDLKTKADFLELRINQETFKEKVDLLKFEKYLKMFENKALSKRIKIFLEIINI